METVCPIELTLKVIGGRWKAMILRELADHGARRYSELKRGVDGITDKVLADHLHELEADGIVIRTAFPEIPPRVEYRLTERGLTLKPVLSLLREWGEAHSSTTGPAAEEPCLGATRRL